MTFITNEFDNRPKVLLPISHLVVSILSRAATREASRLTKGEDEGCTKLEDVCWSTTTNSKIWGFGSFRRDGRLAPL